MSGLMMNLLNLSQLNDKAPFPWQQSQWQLLIQRKQQANLPHALLLTGKQGMGKFAFAQQLAYALLCTSPQADGQACGNCRHCHLLNAHNHPDLTIIQPEKATAMIKIEQIRTLITKMQQTSQLDGYNIVIIEPAEKLNIAAANALLKTLEEPRAKALLILVSAAPHLLPATIRSRCQWITFTHVSDDLINSWLAKYHDNKATDNLLLDIAQGAPLQALALTDPEQLKFYQNCLQQIAMLLQKQLDPLSFAAKCCEESPEKVLRLLMIMLNYAIKQAFSATLKINDPVIADLVTLLANQYQIMDLFRLLDKLMRTQMQIASANNINKQLAVESMVLSLLANRKDNE